MYALDSNSLKELTRQFNAFLPNNFEGSYAVPLQIYKKLN